MKNRVGMASIVGLTLVLTACGGGSDSGSNTSPSTINPVVSGDNILFDNKDTFYTYKLGIDAATTKKSSYTRKDNMLYLKTDHPVTADDYGVYFLTENEFYQPETATTVIAQQGIRDSFIKSVSNNELVLIPYNQQGFKGLEINAKTNTIDLKGKMIAPILAPLDVAFVSFYQNNPDYSGLKLSLVSKMLAANAVFPDGAKCLQPVSTEYNIGNLQFQPNDEKQVIPNVRSLQEWANQAFNDGLAASTLVTKYNWAGYNWGAIALKDYDSQGRIQYLTAIEYQGKVYNARFKSGKELFTDVVERYRQYQLNQGVAEPLVDAVINNLKNNCPTYNDVAAKAIDEAIEKAKNTSVDLPIKGDLPVLDNPSDVPSCNGSLTFC